MIHYTQGVFIMQVAVHGASAYNKPVPKEKTKTSSETFRLTETASLLLSECARVAGVSKAAIIEQSIRDTARRAGVTLPKKTDDKPE
jgi:hypothetical protein